MSAWKGSSKASWYALEAYRKGSSYKWECHNAHGVIMRNDSTLFIGIAGTDDALDLYQGINVHSRSLGGWGRIANIPISKDARSVESTEGFLDYTRNCYEGITARLATIGGEFTQVILCGHSLGGAAAQLLQMTQKFEDCPAYVYGAPKVFKRGELIPSRIRVHAWRVEDLVTYAPISCVHAPAQNLVLSYREGVPRNTIPVSKYATVAVRTTVVWLRGCWASVARKLGWQVKNGLFRPHAMQGYYDLLRC